MAYFLGIDAGGTSTRVVLADETQELARAIGPSVKVMRCSAEDAETRLGVLLDSVAMDAKVDLRHVAQTSVGLSGVSVRAVRDWMQAALASRVGGHVELVGDEVIALDAAFRGGPGILVIAGTGSNIVGRCHSGEMFGAGGWGPVVGDEGSGYWIGTEAVRAGLWAHDRGIATGLLEAVMDHWALRSLDELVARANEHPGPDFAELARVVARLAADGDEVASGILEGAGEELADQVSVVREKMLAATCLEQDAEISVAYTGSVLGQIGAVRRAMLERFAQSLPGVKPVEGPVDALAGALWRARTLHRN